jgi:transposase-like protein
VQTCTSEFIDAARPARHASGVRWFVDESYVKVAARWTYGGFWRSSQQQVADEFDRLVER